MARIIVIEDNVVYCTFICNLLAKEGFETEHAYHLSTARKLLMKMEEDAYAPAARPLSSRR